MPIKTINAFAIIVFMLVSLVSGNLSLASEQVTISKTSGPETVAILELYTSEGCSNCPQAERFLKQLGEKYVPGKNFIPLAFHVDYWDYKGWEDPFSAPQHGERQREIANRNNLRSLYTPQFVLYGTDFPAYNNIPKALTIINDTKPVTTINVNVGLNKQKLNTRINVKANNDRSRFFSDVFIAITENRLSSRVTEGENEGLRLEHEYVVRKFLGPFPLNGKNQLDINRNIDVENNWKLKNLNLVVFAQDKIDGVTHQAVNVPLRSLGK